MKRYNNLFEQIVDYGNIKLAHKNAQKNKKYYIDVINVNKNQEYYLLELQNQLVNKTFNTSKYIVIERKESGKQRVIHKLPYFPDRITHHCILNILEPIWENILIRDTYSSIKNRGIHDGVKRIHSFLKDVENTQYCLKIDIKKFYPNIDNEILKQIIRKKIKCKDTLWLIDNIIDSNIGLPIGNYISQYFSNIYLTYFDHWVKEVLKVKYYCRYCDDMVFFSFSKEKLHRIRKEIRKYLKCELKLDIKDNYQIFDIDIRGLDFLGYRFFHNYTLLRKSIVKKFKRRIRGIKNSNYENPLNILMSYYGWFKYADSYNLWDRYVDKEIIEIINNYCLELSINNPIDQIHNNGVWNMSIKKFSDFAKDELPLQGEKIRIDEVLNKEIIVHDFRVRESKYNDNANKEYIMIQFQFVNQDIFNIFFTGSGVLNSQIVKYKNELPFQTIIKNHYKYYTFT